MKVPCTYSALDERFRGFLCVALRRAVNNRATRADATECISDRLMNVFNALCVCGRRDSELEVGSFSTTVDHF